MNGKVKSAKSNGFGFISTELGVDFFFHMKDFDGDWKNLLQLYINAHEGNAQVAVSFDSDPTATQGPKAINVRLVEV